MRFNVEWTIWSFGFSFGRIPNDLVYIYWFFNIDFGPFSVVVRTNGVISKEGVNVVEI